MGGELEESVGREERLQGDADKCVAYGGKKRELPTNGKPDWGGREVESREFEGGCMEVWYGSRPLGRYSADGGLVQ